MKLGLFINTQFPEGFNLAECVPEMVAQVRAARDAGFASLWFPHHWLTHPMQMLQITPVMGYIAAHERALGGAVLQSPSASRSCGNCTARVLTPPSRFASASAIYHS